MFIERKRKALSKYPLVILLAAILVLMVSILPAQADTFTAYTWQTGISLPSNAAYVYSIQGAVIGHNTTQGFEVALPYFVSTYVAGSLVYWEVTYYVPNDGSTWGVQINLDGFTSTGWSADASYNTTVTTSGSYTGDSPATATNAANTAATDAAAAQTAANTAASNASTAATNASNAYTAANNANTNASTAATQATTAATQATSAASNTTYSGQSAAYWADNANTNASTAATQATGANTQATAAASNTTYGGQSAAYWADQAATALSNNIVPAISSIAGQGGATCTTGSTFIANVAVSPSSSITYAAVISGPGGAPGYAASGNQITINNLSVSGAYTVTVTATYTPTGKTCTFPFTFFKI